MKKNKLKDKAQKIKTKLRIAAAHAENALNHIRDYKKIFKEQIAALELEELHKELARRMKK